MRKDVDELHEVRRPQLFEELYFPQCSHVHTLSHVEQVKLHHNSTCGNWRHMPQEI